MLNENAGNAACSRTSCALIHGGATGPACRADHPAAENVPSQE